MGDPCPEDFVGTNWTFQVIPWRGNALSEREIKGAVMLRTSMYLTVQVTGRSGTFRNSGKDAQLFRPGLGYGKDSCQGSHGGSRCGAGADGYHLFLGFRGKRVGGQRGYFKIKV